MLTSPTYYISVHLPRDQKTLNKRAHINKETKWLIITVLTIPVIPSCVEQKQ